MISCNRPDDGEGELEFIWFEVSGKVIDMAGSPVGGITVMAGGFRSCSVCGQG